MDDKTQDKTHKLPDDEVLGKNIEELSDDALDAASGGSGTNAYDILKEERRQRGIRPKM